MSKNYVVGKVAKKRRGLSCISIFLLGTVLLAPQLSMSERSVYTSFEKKCRTTTYQKQPARECPGVWGWRLMLVYEAERSYLVIKKQGYEKSLRDDIYSEEIGQFPEIPAATRVEWRLNSQGRPRALILRVYAVNPKKSLQEDPNPFKSSLLVVRLGSIACVLGIVNDNVHSRLLADSYTACENDL